MPAALPERLLVVSLSGRMLARSAVRAGIRPVVCDLYGDADTRDAAARCQVVGGGPAGFAGPDLLAVAERDAGGLPLVYGSGFDGQPHLLERLAAGRVLYGNHPDVIRGLKTPESFFALLDRLRIPYPAVRWDFPADPERWLIKAGCGEGGKRVRFCAQEQPAEPGEYYQQRLRGPAGSVLFQADGRRAAVIGFNTLWSVAGTTQPFLYVGAVNRAPLTAKQRAVLADRVERLTRMTELRGIASLDFLLNRSDCPVLEVNPRPSATLALYDADFAEGLLACHLRGCRGELTPGPPPGPARALRTVIAPHPIQVPERFVWPPWCVDRPMPGSRIAAGQPFCSVAAEGEGVASVVRQLTRYRRAILVRFPAAAETHLY